jgi:DNA-binding response OmpR family regulator
MSRHLLIAESKESIRSAYEFHFARAGFEVPSFATLREALECADQVAFDAVIADAGLDAGLLAATLGVDIFLHKPASLPWLEGEIRARIDANRLAARARGLVLTVPDAARPRR